MHASVAVTDGEWFPLLRERLDLDEVDLWHVGRKLLWRKAEH